MDLTESFKTLIPSSCKKLGKSKIKKEDELQSDEYFKREAIQIVSIFFLQPWAMLPIYSAFYFHIFR